MCTGGRKIVCFHFLDSLSLTCKACDEVKGNYRSERSQVKNDLLDYSVPFKLAMATSLCNILLCLIYSLLFYQTSTKIRFDRLMEA